MVVVPRCWEGQTVVCIGSGPSLTGEDVASCRGRARVIAVKDAYRLAPWADAIYACGADRSNWWSRHWPTMTSATGLRYTLDPAASAYATVLEATGVDGLELQPSGLRTGRNSGYQAINLAVHLGAAKIVLLGYDLMRASDGTDHYFGDHPHGVKPPFEEFRPLYATLVAPLAALGIPIVNASRRTALDCFPCQPLAEALA